MITAWRKGAALGVALAVIAAAAQDDDSALPALGLRSDAPDSAPAGLTLPGAELMPEPTKSIREMLVEANALVQADEHDAALAIFLQVLERRPRYRPALNGMAIIAIRQHRYLEAIETMEILLADVPNDVVTMNNLAWVYAAADDPAARNGRRAVELGQKALLVSPRNYHIWSTVSEGHHITGDFDKALAAAEEALRIALVARASSDNLREYRHQITKNRKAIDAFSLLD